MQSVSDIGPKFNPTRLNPRGTSLNRSLGTRCRPVFILFSVFSPAYEGLNCGLTPQNTKAASLARRFDENHENAKILQKDQAITHDSGFRGVTRRYDGLCHHAQRVTINETTA